MIIAFDTYYSSDKAKTVCIAFNDWADKTPLQVYGEVLTGVEEYIPGQFYRRELPCILSLLRQIDSSEVHTIIVDGFVVLDDDGTPGLGGYLYEALNSRIPVIGVAKTNFARLQTLKRELLRGSSNRPLYITAIGLPVDAATEKISRMDGGYRIPSLLKELDRLTRVL